MRRVEPLKAVVFDFDGTLMDSLSLVLEAIAHAVEPFGPRPTMEIFPHLGGPPERFLRALVGDVKNLPTALERLEVYHRENAHLIQPYAGVRELLAQLRAAGIQVALWTGRDRASLDWLMAEHQLGPFFSTAVSGDDLPTHKPDPAGLREIMRRLGVRPAETLLVGDADVDVLGGAACGVDTLLIRHSREVEVHVSEKCWQVVRSPVEAFQVVLGCLAKIS